MERTFDLTKSLADVGTIPASVGKPLTHPSQDFYGWMNGLKKEFDDLNRKFVHAAGSCGHKNEAHMCRHAQQMFVKPCAMRDCPLLR
jgi:hypothetical protein